MAPVGGYFNMIKLAKIYKKVLREFERDGDVDHEVWDRYDYFISRVLQLFWEENNEDYTHNMGWKLVPFNRLKRIWEEWAKFGFVRDEKGLEYISDIMVSNTIKISVLTMLAGHTSESPDDYYEDAWGDHIREYIKSYMRFKHEPDGEEQYVSRDPNQLEVDWDNKNGQYSKKNSRDLDTVENINNPFLDTMMVQVDEVGPNGMYDKIMEELQGRFIWYYIEDPKIGQARISDYGLKPLIDLTSQLRSAYDSSSKVVIIDKMLNVVHQRSDMASWFVEGGSRALADLSASPSEREEN